MPTIGKGQSDHAKVYRPTGTLYSVGHGTLHHEASADALTNFVDEFGHKPRQELTVIEVIGTTIGWRATVFEIP